MELGLSTAVNNLINISMVYCAVQLHPVLNLGDKNCFRKSLRDMKL